MILSNYWKWLNAILTIDPYLSDGNSHDNVGMKDLSGNNVTSTFSSDDARRPWSARSFNNGGVRLGSGNAEITVNDYAMSSDITDNIDDLNYTVNSAGTDEGLSRTIAISGINNTANNMTITEVGYYINNYDYNNTTYKVLMAKVKLTEPVIVATGGNFLINVEWLEV